MSCRRIQLRYGKWKDKSNSRLHCSVRSAVFIVLSFSSRNADEIAAFRSVITAAAPFGKAKVVFLIPGGGSQFDDMGRELYRNNRVFRKYMDICLGIFRSTENRRAV